jgi:hypothetical protein
MTLCLVRKDNNFEHARPVGLDHCIHLHSKLAASCTPGGKKTQVFLYADIGQNTGSSSGMLCRCCGPDDYTAADRDR